MANDGQAPIGFDEMPPEDAFPETAGASWERGLLQNAGDTEERNEEKQE